MQIGALVAGRINATAILLIAAPEYKSIRVLRRRREGGKITGGMLPESSILFGQSILPPALVAGVLLVAFIAWQYWWERGQRRQLRRSLEGGRSRGPTEQLAGVPAAAASGGNGVCVSRGTGMPEADPDLFPAFGKYSFDHLGRYGLALLFVCVALLVRTLLEPALHGQVSYGFFLLAVVATALVADLWETLFALVVGFLVADYFFVDPPGFKIGTAGGWWGALIYWLTGLGILWFMRSEHTAWMRTLDRDIAYVDRLAELDHERAARHQSPTDRELLASIVDGAQDAILSVTRQGRIATWNAAAETLLGFSAPEAIGQPLALIVPPERRAEEQRLLDQINRGERAEEWQTLFHAKSGSPIAVSLTLSPVKRGSGELVGVSLIARASSRRVPAESSLR